MFEENHLNDYKTGHVTSLPPLLEDGSWRSSIVNGSLMITVIIIKQLTFMEYDHIPGTKLSA